MTNAETPVESIEAVGRIADPDPFQLTRNLKQRVRCCTRASCGGTEELTYLWIDLSHAPNSLSERLSVEDWFNVVDEAASLGVSWVVFSLEDSPSTVDGLWDICQWAQNAYGMVAGLHLRTGELNKADLDALKKLDYSRCHLFVPQCAMDHLQTLSKEGYSIHLAEVEHEHNGLCNMPGNMVFVKPDGSLYTCGMVKQNQDYLLGHILEKKLNHIVRDPSLPHAVPEQAAEDAHGCDGCPPLVARQVQGQ